MSEFQEFLWQIDDRWVALGCVLLAWAIFLAGGPSLGKRRRK